MRKPNKTKAAKRRLRNKRRNQQKQLHRQAELQGYEQMEDNETEQTIDQSAVKPQRTKQQQTKPNFRKEIQRMSEEKSNEQRNFEAQQLWQKTYENALKWICSHQVRYWRQLAGQYQRENEMLKAKLYARDCGTEMDEEYITSSSSSDAETNSAVNAEGIESDVSDVDESYVKFLEVTLRHREELRKTREQEADQSVGID